MSLEKILIEHVRELELQARQLNQYTGPVLNTLWELEPAFLDEILKIRDTSNWIGEDLYKKLKDSLWIGDLIYRIRMCKIYASYFLSAFKSVENETAAECYNDILELQSLCERMEKTAQNIYVLIKENDFDLVNKVFLYFKEKNTTDLTEYILETKNEIITAREKINERLVNFDALLKNSENEEIKALAIECLEEIKKIWNTCYTEKIENEFIKINPSDCEIENSEVCAFLQKVANDFYISFQVLGPVFKKISQEIAIAAETLEMDFHFIRSRAKDMVYAFDKLKELEKLAAVCPKKSYS